MRWPRRGWSVLRYRSGANPTVMSRHWTQAGADRALLRWRDHNRREVEMPLRAQHQFLVAHRPRRGGRHA